LAGHHRNALQNSATRGIPQHLRKSRSPRRSAFIREKECLIGLCYFHVRLTIHRSSARWPGRYSPQSGCRASARATDAGGTSPTSMRDPLANLT
jgi:hypothetical protein